MILRVVAVDGRSTGFDLLNAAAISMTVMNNSTAVVFLRKRTIVLMNGGMGIAVVKILASFLRPSPFQLCKDLILS